MGNGKVQEKKLKANKSILYYRTMLWFKYIAIVMWLYHTWLEIYNLCEIS